LGTAAATLLVLFVLLLVIATVPTATLFVALGVLTLLIFLITARPNIDTVVVVVVLAISWASIPKSVSLSVTGSLTVPRGEHAFAAIGDSYMSGEGAEEFYRGTNVKGVNECRRAPTAYSVRLAEDHENEAAGVPGRVMFYACSGAVAANLYLTPQSRGDPVGAPRELQLNGSYEGGETQVDQFEHGQARSQPLLDFTLVSVGGNDVNFGSVVQTCVAPGDCSVFANRWYALINSLPKVLYPAYRAIGEATPRGRVIVVPYPIPVGDAPDCPSSTFTLKERKFLMEFTTRLDQKIADEARRHHYLVANTRDALKDQNARLCDSGRIGINSITLNPTQGQVSQAADPRNWVHDSMHPNKYGHAIVADALASWLAQASTQRSLEAIKSYDPPPPPPPPPASDPCTRCPKYCEPNSTGCETHWAVAQIGGVLTRWSWALALWTAASWLLACWVIGRWRYAGTQKNNAGANPMPAQR